MILVWLFTLAVVLVKTTKCEPPVNSYLPPTTGSGGRPASQYGPPNIGQGRPGSGSQNQLGGNFNAPENYPSNSLSTEYGVPGQGSSGFPRDGPLGRLGQAPSAQYGTPNQRGGGGGGSSPFRGRGSAQRPDTSYGTPSGDFQSGNFNGGNAGSQYQGPGQRFGGSPSSSYGTPDFGNGLDSKNENYRGSGVDRFNEPAKYEFSYDVDDATTGTKFGRSERRDGDVTTGEYNVVLPDGRKQVVEYEADREGYKPQIRYEGTGGGSGSGFGRGGRGQGYASADADAEAFAGSGAGYPQQPGSGQSGRYQQPGSGQSGRYQQPGSGQSGKYQQPGFGSGPSAGGYPSNEQGLNGDGLGGSGGYPSGPQSGRGRGFQGGGNSPGSQGGYPGGRPQGGRNGPQGGNDGYPSGGPNGQRGSGY